MLPHPYPIPSQAAKIFYAWEGPGRRYFQIPFLPTHGYRKGQWMRGDTDWPPELILSSLFYIRL